MPLIGLEPADVPHSGSAPADGKSGPGWRAPAARRGGVYNHRASPRTARSRVVMRTTGVPFFLQVHADGGHIGEWGFQPSGSGWQETTFTIPAESISSASLRVRLSPPGDAPLGTHTAYHYWFVQRR